MKSSSIPAKFPIPWANAAQAQFIRAIPVASQIGIQDGAASLTTGFVPDNFTQLAAGGVPPFGQDFNGILKQITQWNQWQQVGGPITYDPDFSSSIGGYPQGTILGSAIVPGRLWLSTADDNTQNPDAYPFAGWTTPPGMLPPGTPLQSFQAAVLPGCVLANGLTIGNAGSGGTTAPTALASAQTFLLFCAIWLQFSQSECPVMFNGSAVTRGANPNVDWQDGRVIQLPWMAGAGIIGQDNMGMRASSFLGGVPVQSGSLNSPASIIGEDVHTLAASEIPSITSTNNAGVNFSAGGSTSSPVAVSAGTSAFNGGTSPLNQVQFATVSVSVGGVIPASNISIVSTNAGGGAHNTVQRSFTVAWNLSL